MGKQTVIRVGDQHSHGGKVVTGSAGKGNGTAHGRPIARVGDKVVCPKHGMQKIITGSPKAKLQGRAVAIAGSKTSCGAILLPNPTEKSNASS